MMNQATQTLPETARLEADVRRPLHSFVEAWARSTPDKAAILVDDVVVTYAELERRAEQLAVYLKNQGVGRGDRVGLLLNRSAQAIYGMVATLKLGAIFLPIDITFPLQRIEMMIEDAQPRALLSLNAVLEGRPDLAAAGWRVVDIDEAITATPAPAQPLEAIEPSSAAYLLYTSGSTGRPKGVLGVHSGITRLVLPSHEGFFDKDSVCLHITALTFDPSQVEIWGALVNGGTIAILPDALPSLDRICEVIHKHGATWSHMTTGIFHLMVDHRLDGLRPLKTVWASGDVLSLAHANRAVAALPDTQVVNEYGPTENGVATTWFIMPKGGWDGPSVPIGWTCPFTTTYVLDDDLKPVPEGEIGQLCTGGLGLAEGYYGRPDLTAERFVENPKWLPDEPRIYLTGDRVRRRPDGLIEFIGRNDRQVKINNKRVELDEIENIIRQDSRIADAAVMLISEGEDLKRLIGYLKPAGDVALADRGAFAQAVSASLASSLPEHMLPGEFHVMDAFPLTESGKLDRRMLPVPKRPAAEQGGAAEGRINQTELERIVSDIWKATLKLDFVGLDSNFFDLGGSSLQLVKIHAQIQNDVRSDVELMDLFENVTVRDLAAFLAGDGKAGAAEIKADQKERSDRRAEALQRAREQRARIRR